MREIHWNLECGHWNIVVDVAAVCRLSTDETPKINANDIYIGIPLQWAKVQARAKDPKVLGVALASMVTTQLGTTTKVGITLGGLVEKVARARMTMRQMMTKR